MLITLLISTKLFLYFLSSLEHLEFINMQVDLNSNLLFLYTRGFKLFHTGAASSSKQVVMSQVLLWTQTQIKVEHSSFPPPADECENQTARWSSNIQLKEGESKHYQVEEDFETLSLSWTMRKELMTHLIAGCDTTAVHEVALHNLNSRKDLKL